VEAPTVGGSIAKVANFGSVTFTSATAVINGVTGGINAPGWSSVALNMGSGSATYDTTSVLSSSGESFTVSCNSVIGAGSRSGTGVVEKSLSGKITRPRIQPGPEIGRFAGTAAVGQTGFPTRSRTLSRIGQRRLDQPWAHPIV